MNVVLLVVDSLRACSLFRRGAGAPRTPFLERLDAETVSFKRAYASECWTLPSHASMFTGLLPSQHGAHFQSMGYTRPAPTIAELLAAAGHHTEVVTRNCIFDGSLPGITRGFQHNTCVLSDHRPWHPMPLLLAMSKPRFRRQIRTSGFFHPLQRQSRRFASTFARSVLPADRPALHHVARADGRAAPPAGGPLLLLQPLRRPRPVPAGAALDHAPAVGGPRGWGENLRLPFVMPCLGGTTYLPPRLPTSRSEPAHAARPLPPRHRADGREAGRLHTLPRATPDCSTTPS